MSLDDRDLELIRATSQETVRIAFTELGFNPDDPQEAQETMAFAREMKDTRDLIRSKVLGAVVTFAVLGVLGLVAIGAKSKWFSGAGP